VNPTNLSSLESNEEQSSQTQNQQQSPTSSQQPANQSVEITPPLIYILCVPVTSEVEHEWLGSSHTISMNKHIAWASPLNTKWKTTTMFLLTQQTSNLEMFKESFNERLSKINAPPNDLFYFDTEIGQTLRKRSCFEKVDRAMNDLAHAILSLSNCVANNVEQFENIIEQRNKNINEKVDTRSYIVNNFFYSTKKRSYACLF
jgi:hypothetical protein